MNQHLIGGTTTLEQVGKVWNEGAVVIPKVTVDGKQFLMPTPKDAVIRGLFRDQRPNKEDDAWVFLWHNRQGWNNGDPGNLQWVEMRVGDPASGFWFRGTPVKVTYKITEGKLQGHQEIGPITIKLDKPVTNPRHYMARWIIRLK